MARINAHDFVGTRCRFQRLRDAKLFNGWIEDFNSEKLDVSTSAEATAQVGEEFRFEGFGHHISVVFTARIEEVGLFDLTGPGGSLSVVDGSSARMLESRRSTFRMTVCGPLRFSASPESVRMQTPDLPIRIAFGASEVEGVAVDVSPNGIGVVSREEVKPGSTVAVQIATPTGPIRAQGLIRYCRKDTERDGHFRFGVMFTEMGRIERPKWDHYLRELT